MQDFTDTTDQDRMWANAQDDGRDNSHSREGDLASDKLGVPLLSDAPAPLSQALHIPTLIGDKPETETSRGKAIGMLDDYTRSQWRGVEPIQANDDRSPFDTFGRRRPAGETTARAPDAGTVETNRATTPAAPPREDSATFVGVPSNHPKSVHSEKLEKLDKVALFVGAIVVIGPLFAAMLGRMAL